MDRTAPTAAQIAAAASDMRLLSVYSDIEFLIDHVSDQRRGKSPEADIADLAFDRLQALLQEMDTLIARLAPIEAAREAEVAAELAAAEAADLAGA